ncbi:hypothetical protein GF318_00330 [Candidatus Micrarchaeota archaeon]|nr:hypothetical protein [Candidatus Micrarchaeota archaeon]
MRGVLLLLVVSGLLISGCISEETENNVTNITNITNITDNQTEDNESEVECGGPVCGGDGNTYETDCEAIDAGVAVLHYGPCEVEQPCVETDNGIELEVRGTVSKGNESNTDYCVDSRQLVEYACLDNDMEMATFSCGEDRECVDGACVEAEEPEPPPAGCAGPTEAGIYSRNSVIYNGSTYQDVCIEADVVKDYYCRDNKLESVNTQCPVKYGCTEGKCVELTYECTDGDNGTYIFDRERVVGTRGHVAIFDHWDECVDGGMVKEYFCRENNTAAFQEIECGSGYKCVNGRCVESECSETDGGLDYFKGGITKVEGRDREYEDKCFTDYEIREYYCYGDDVEYKETKCPKGYICLDYRCVEGSIS